MDFVATRKTFSKSENISNQEEFNPNEIKMNLQKKIPDGKMLLPLSGSGKPISWENHAGGRQVTWGDTKFHLPNELIEDILKNYFKNPTSWYVLGASMDDPVKGGLGEYIQNKTTLTPRHASAIAAIMVYENLIEAKGKRPIKLRKLAD